MTSRNDDALDWLGLGGKNGELPGTRPDLAEEFGSEQVVLAALGALVPPADPPAGLLGKIEKTIDAQSKSKFTTLRADEGKWVKRTSKVWQKILNKDPSTGRAIYLLRCEPGAVIPPHPHMREEHVLVLEGSYTIGKTLVRAGDYQHSRAGTLHGTIRSKSGCLVLIHC